MVLKMSDAPGTEQILGTLLLNWTVAYQKAKEMSQLFWFPLMCAQRGVVREAELRGCHIPVGGYWGGRRKSPAVAIADTRTEVPSILALLPDRADTSAPVIAPDMLALICHKQLSQYKLEAWQESQFHMRLYLLMIGGIWLCTTICSHRN